MTPLIKLVDIKKQYVDNAPFVLKGINLDIHRGEFIALMGVSGSGKSTLMNIIGLLDVATSGQYFFSGNDITTLDDNGLSTLRNRHIGFVFQSFYLIPYLNVLDNIMLPRFYAKTEMEGDARKKGLELLDIVGLSDKAKSRPSQLSGGQQQRVAIARAMINSPELILADEPTGQLDSNTSNSIMEYISTLPERTGCTVLLVTHDAETAAYAQKKVIIKDGLIES